MSETAPEERTDAPQDVNEEPHTVPADDSAATPESDRLRESGDEVDGPAEADPTVADGEDVPAESAGAEDDDVPENVQALADRDGSDAAERNAERKELLESPTLTGGDEVALQQGRISTREELAGSHGFATFINDEDRHPVSGPSSPVEAEADEARPSVGDEVGYVLSTGRVTPAKVIYVPEDNRDGIDLFVYRDGGVRESVRRGRRVGGWDEGFDFESELPL